MEVRGRNLVTGLPKTVTVTSSETEEALRETTGQIVEAAETFALFRAPRHPYTQGLLKAIPSLEGTADRLYTIRGSVPDPRCPLPGCRFCPRCDQSRQDCARQVPDLRALAAGHWVRCCHIS